MDGPVEGFAIPVHRALIEPILLGGAPLAGWVLNRVKASVQAQVLLQGSRIGRKELRRYFRA